MFMCPRMEAEFQGVSSQTWRIRTTRNGVSLLSEDASAWRIASSMSSCSYYGLAMQELVHRNWKVFRIDPKTASSGKADQ